MSGLILTVKGFDRVIKKLKDAPKHIIDSVDIELSSLAQDYANRAHAAAPHNHGNLKAHISAVKISPLRYEIVSGAEYSAYIEFGTRSKVQVPAELQKYAAQFRGGGGKTDPQESIYAWCKAVGIPEEAWYPIFIKIMTKGINPHPFFFIHLPWARNEIKHMKHAIKKALAK